MTTLRDFLAQREEEIKGQLKKLREELVEIKKAKSALSAGPSIGGESGSDSESTRKTTIKDMIREVMAAPDAAQGVAAGSILDKIEAYFNTSIERTSLSPQLSRLRDQGELVLIDGKWFPSEPRLGEGGAIGTIFENQCVSNGIAPGRQITMEEAQALIDSPATNVGWGGWAEIGGRHRPKTE